MSRSLGHPLEAAAWGWSQDKDSPGKSRPAPGMHLWPSVFPQEVLHPHGPDPRGVMHHPATHPHPRPRLLGSSPGDSWPGCETHLSGGPRWDQSPRVWGLPSASSPGSPPALPPQLQGELPLPATCAPLTLSCASEGLCPTRGNAGCTCLTGCGQGRVGFPSLPPHLCCVLPPPHPLLSASVASVLPEMYGSRASSLCGRQVDCLGPWPGIGGGDGAAPIPS